MPTIQNQYDVIELRVQSLLEQAELWHAEHQPQRARQFYSQAIELDPGSNARLQFGGFLYRSGEEQEAITQWQLAMEIAKRQDNFRDRASAAACLSEIHRERGESAAAESFQQQEIAARIQEQSLSATKCFESADYVSLANSAISRGDLEHAEQLVQFAMHSAERKNCPEEIADAWGTWGALAFLQNEPQAAWRCFLRSHFFHCLCRDHVGRIADLLNLAQTSRELGWWNVSQRLLFKAHRDAVRLGFLQFTTQIENRLAEAEKVLGVAKRTPEWN